MAKKVDYVTIEMVHGDYWFCENGVYPHDSVLAGQDFRQLVRAYDSLEDAIAAHPEAEVCEHGRYIPEAYIPECAPSWFDPMDAGEVWSEDDY